MIVRAASRTAASTRIRGATLASPLSEDGDHLYANVSVLPDRRRRPELCFIALAGEEVVGFASLDVPGRSERAYAAARRAGLRRLVTESEERNVPLGRLNEKLGYRPIPGMVVLRGPLASDA